jgi:L-alanine-DL-glutamate epimerase-like enolase superfamily enzyme
VRWLEEPFFADQYGAYRELASRTRSVGIAGGEASHNSQMAINLIDYGHVGFIQIDCGRIGGLGEAKRVADYAHANGVTYVNHTFTSQLALSASLQPFAGLRDHDVCEYPAEPKQLALDLTRGALLPDANGTISAPDAPGLGMEVNMDAVDKYQVQIDIIAGGVALFSSPTLVSARVKTWIQ